MGGGGLDGALGGGVWHKASVSDCVPLAAPIGLWPPLSLTLCGSERVLVVSTEPPDDLSCLTTPGVGRPLGGGGGSGRVGWGGGGGSRWGNLGGGGGTCPQGQELVGVRQTVVSGAWLGPAHARRTGTECWGGGQGRGGSPLPTPSHRLPAPLFQDRPPISSLASCLTPIVIPPPITIQHPLLLTPSPPPPTTATILYPCSTFFQPPWVL